MIRAPPRYPLFPSPTLSQSELPRRQRVLAEQRLEQRGLPRPVRSDQAQDVAADQRPGEPLDERSIPDSHGDVRGGHDARSEEHTSELQSRQYLVCRLLLEKK